MPILDRKGDGAVARLGAQGDLPAETQASEALKEQVREALRSLLGL